MKVAVVGAGWAGLAAAVRARQAGHAVTVYEAAGMPGGRARSDAADGLDNGQHILLGGYVRTLALMRDVGVDVESALLRLPLAVTYADGAGFALSAGGGRLRAVLAALATARGFTLLDKLSLARMAAGWQLRGFRCAPSLTVDALLRHGPSERIRKRLVEPLCVAALNTPPAQASAAVFLAVMRDSLFGDRTAADLLLPRRPLAQLLPLPAVAWLLEHGATIRLRRRVTGIEPTDAGWHVRSDGGGEPGREEKIPTDDDSPPHDRVVLATPAGEAARLARPHAPRWAAIAGDLRHEPIVTITLRSPRQDWPAAMLALDSDADHRPAQFAFKIGPQPVHADRVTFVVSAAGDWLARGLPAVTAAVVAQCRATFDIGADEEVTCLDARADRRATFRCEAGVARPPRHVAPGLLAAADYVEGPYPATLEAAVRAGEAAAAALD